MARASRSGPEIPHGAQRPYQRREEKIGGYMVRGLSIIILGIREVRVEPITATCRWPRCGDRCHPG